HAVGEGRRTGIAGQVGAGAADPSLVVSFGARLRYQRARRGLGLDQAEQAGGLINVIEVSDVGGGFGPHIAQAELRGVGGVAAVGRGRQVEVRACLFGENPRAVYGAVHGRADDAGLAGDGVIRARIGRLCDLQRVVRVDGADIGDVDPALGAAQVARGVDAG